MLDRAGSTAAPLLATVSFALVALVLQLGPTIVRWPGTALAVLVGAGLLLIGCVQAILWTRGQDRGVWAVLARILYDSGTLALIAAIALILVPPGVVSSARWAAICLACLGFIIELAWSAAAGSREATGLIRIRDVQRWQCALNPELTVDEIKTVRDALQARGIASSRDALKESKRVGHPLGRELIGQTNVGTTESARHAE